MTTAKLLAVVAYVVLGRIAVRSSSAIRDPAFAILNLLAVFVFYYWTPDTEVRVFHSALFAAYVLMVIVQYGVFRLFGTRSGRAPWIAFMTPIAFLIAVRGAELPNHLAFLLPENHPRLNAPEIFPLGAIFFGISYLAFRASYLVLEVRNGIVPAPNLWQYLGFVFFLPTISVGPISPYSQHLGSITHPEKFDLPWRRALLRVLTGAVKYQFFGPILNRLTYSGLLLDGHPHLWVDLPIAAVAYYLYLYCNFSGFCDIAIGLAGLMGVSVMENFDNPFIARNMKVFWNRWHISLSTYMRDVVFSPLSKYLVRTLGPKQVNLSIAITVFVVFLLVGIWHGFGWNYAVFGLLHGAGVASNHYYTIWLKQRLGKAGFAAYNNSKIIHAIAIVMTFSYVTACLFVFANDGKSMATIFSNLRFQ